MNNAKAVSQKSGQGVLKSLNSGDNSDVPCEVAILAAADLLLKKLFGPRAAPRDYKATLAKQDAQVLQICKDKLVKQDDEDLPTEVSTDSGFSESELPTGSSTDSGFESELPTGVSTDSGFESELPTGVSNDSGFESELPRGVSISKDIVSWTDEDGNMEWVLSGPA